MLWCFVIVEQNAPCLISFFQFKIFKYEPGAIVVLVSKLQLSSLSDVSNYNLQHYGFCAVKKQIKRLHVSSVQLFLCAACYSASLNKMFSQLEYAFKTANRWLSGYFDSNTALCGYPLLKLEIRDSCHISTRAAIFFHYNYFRQTIWRLASVQFHF